MTGFDGVCTCWATPSTCSNSTPISRHHIIHTTSRNCGLGFPATGRVPAPNLATDPSLQQIALPSPLHTTASALAHTHEHLKEHSRRFSPHSPRGSTARRNPSTLLINSHTQPTNFCHSVNVSVTSRQAVTHITSNGHVSHFSYFLLPSTTSFSSLKSTDPPVIDNTNGPYTMAPDAIA